MEDKVDIIDRNSIAQFIYQDGKLMLVAKVDGEINIYPEQQNIPGMETKIESIDINWIKNECVVLPTGISMESHDTLITDLKKYFEEKFIFEEQQLWLLALYAYYTWHYDRLETAPYLFIVGDIETGISDLEGNFKVWSFLRNN